jgi:ribosomal protein S18 acetylase RimI-like enzyme
MPNLYYNFDATLAENRWERRLTLRAWWRLSAADETWTPPYYTLLRRALETEALQRQTIALLRLEAMSRTQPQGVQRLGGGTFPEMAQNGLLIHRPVATALLLRASDDPTQGFLSLFACINSAATRDALLETVNEVAREAGCRTLSGPLGPLPFLSGGAQQSHWHRPPPVDAPHSPPYLAELLAQRLAPLRLPSGAPAGGTTLYQVPVAVAAAAAGPATIGPLRGTDPADLVPLLQAALPAGLPPPDQQTATLLLQWLRTGRLTGWLARIAGEPAGFLVLRQDNRRWMQRLGRGRTMPARTASLFTLPVDPQGYVPLAAVLPEHRTQGIGRQLWQHAMRQAARDGQETLLVGPLGREQSAATAILQRIGQPEATFLRFSTLL